MKTAIVVILIVVAVVFLILCAASIYAFSFAIIRPKKPPKPETDDVYIKRAEIRKQNNQNLYDLNPEDITIKSIDNLNMKAWFLPSDKASKRFVICVHGYKCNGPDEFSHMMPFYHYDLGYNYLLPDLVAHGRSEGKYIGFGSHDHKNILLWVKYLVDRFGKDIEIILHGISMGAATVMMVNQADVPEQVKLIIEDCGYSSAHDQMVDTLKGMIGFKFPVLVSMAGIVCKIRAGYSFKEIDPLKNMEKSKKPTLFIHGEGDDFVPTWMGKALYEAASVPKDCLWVENAVHAFCYYDAKEAYEDKVKSFIINQLGSLQNIEGVGEEVHV